MINNANSHWIHPDRNEKRVEHIKCFNAFSEQLQLVQISNILRLNVLLFVGKLPISVLGTVMLCHAKEFGKSRGDSLMMPTIVTQSLDPTFILGADNFPC